MCLNLFYFSCSWVGESPRWLWAENRMKEAAKEVKSAARMNKKPMVDLSSDIDHKPLNSV